MNIPKVTLYKSVIALAGRGNKSNEVILTLFDCFMDNEEKEIQLRKTAGIKLFKIAISDKNLIYPFLPRLLEFFSKIENVAGLRGLAGTMMGESFLEEKAVQEAFKLARNDKAVQVYQPVEHYLSILRKPETYGLPPWYWQRD